MVGDTPIIREEYKERDEWMMHGYWIKSGQKYTITYHTLFIIHILTIFETESKINLSFFPPEIYS